jgi:GTP-binding protein Era
MGHKAGFVNIIGNPNVGKSTLMNALVGERLSIMTPKAQTTRHRIMGIANGDDYQVVFSDTPGILTPKYKLQEKMMNFVDSAFEDADILLFITEVNEKFDKTEILEKISKLNIPIIVAINKVDLSDQVKAEQIVEQWKQLLPKAEVFLISALHNFNIQGLLIRILDILPENPPYYSKEDLSDKNMRFFISEIIREKILLNYQKEIPYSVEVVVESYKELEDIVHINTTIYVERDSQKGILIGPKGSALKRTVTQARHEMERFVGKKVFLETFVKVRKDWRGNENMLKGFGY